MASADRHLTKHNLGKLRELCRAHDRQSSLFSGILDTALNNILGPSFDFIPTTGDDDLNKVVKQFITRRMEPDLCDAAGITDFAGIARLALRAVWTDGDILLVKRKDGSLLPFEADQVVTPSDKNSRRVVLGVELNDVNRPIAYHLKQRHTSGDHGMTRATQKSQRVLRQHVIMPAYRKRFNQTRGLPFMAAALGSFDRTNSYLDFESIAAELNAMLGFKIKKEQVEGTTFSGTKDNKDDATSDTFEKLQQMEPGAVFDLAPGEDVGMIGSERPGSNFEPYIVTCCRIIGVGVGFPLELMMLDFSKTNYSSARASLGEARRMFKVWQRFAASLICMPWYRWQIARAIASGKLPANPNIFKARCQWPAWQYIDPLKEAKGNMVAIAARAKSISECVRERGAEPDEVFAEIASEQKKLKALGIEFETDPKDKKNKKKKDRAA